MKVKKKGKKKEKCRKQNKKMSEYQKARNEIINNSK